jgi:DNA-binding response OmpR family regulator
MDKSIISILKNKIFFKVVSELKLFTQPKFYEDLSLCIDESNKNNQIIIFFLTEKNIKDFNQIIKKNLPLIVIAKTNDLQNVESGDLVIKLNLPFTIDDFKKKIVRLNAKVIFQKSSLIKLNDYIINKNERVIKKNNKELQLTEKEINFLILFSKSKEPVSRTFVLKNIWNYSSESETHTVETHIHRLRKKILGKFGDNNFIKNNTRGYYI